MNDLISRAAVKQAFIEYKNSMKVLTPFEINRLVDLFAIIKDLPAVDAASVVHARWLECEDNWGDCHYQCSECGCEWCLNDGTPEENGMKFCPNCGAKMDGERRDGA